MYVRECGMTIDARKIKAMTEKDEKTKNLLFLKRLKT